jgi:hypothetical protein
LFVLGLSVLMLLLTLGMGARVVIQLVKEISRLDGSSETQRFVSLCRHRSRHGVLTTPSSLTELSCNILLFSFLSSPLATVDGFPTASIADLPPPPPVTPFDGRWPHGAVFHLSYFSSSGVARSAFLGDECYDRTHSCSVSYRSAVCLAASFFICGSSMGSFGS